MPKWLTTNIALPLGFRIFNYLLLSSATRIAPTNKPITKPKHISAKAIIIFPSFYLYKASPIAIPNATDPAITHTTTNIFNIIIFLPFVFYKYYNIFFNKNKVRSFFYFKWSVGTSAEQILLNIYSCEYIIIFNSS